MILLHDSIHKRAYSCFFSSRHKNDGKHCDVYISVTIPKTIIPLWRNYYYQGKIKVYFLRTRVDIYKDLFFYILHEIKNRYHIFWSESYTSWSTTQIASFPKPSMNTSVNVYITFF